MELVCPAGNLPSLKAAVDNGADSVYVGFKDDTNARHFGLNFTDRTFRKAIDYAQSRGRKLFVAINTYPQPSRFERWQRAVDQAADHGVDALILADWFEVLRWAGRADFVPSLPEAARPHAREVRAALAGFLAELPGGVERAAQRYGDRLAGPRPGDE